jgi:hypothetical protein
MSQIDNLESALLEFGSELSISPGNETVLDGIQQKLDGLKEDLSQLQDALTTQTPEQTLMEINSIFDNLDKLKEELGAMLDTFQGELLDV